MPKQVRHDNTLFITLKALSENSESAFPRKILNELDSSRCYDKSQGEKTKGCLGIKFYRTHIINLYTLLFVVCPQVTMRKPEMVLTY